MTMTCRGSMKLEEEFELENDRADDKLRLLPNFHRSSLDD